jgi:hypothetical protein
MLRQVVKAARAKRTGMARMITPIQKNMNSMFGSFQRARG